MFHHCRPLEFSPYGEVRQEPNPKTPDMELTYQWLAKRIGYHPMFLAVGGGDAYAITGYDQQFKKYSNGKGRNEVLFSFNDIPEPRFTDYDNWHIVLNSLHYPRYSDVPTHVEEVSDYIVRLIMKPSWKKSDWLREARKNRGSVQAHTEKLDLTAADEIWCRNKPTKKALVKRGFDEDKIDVRRKVT